MIITQQERSFLNLVYSCQDWYSLWSSCYHTILTLPSRWPGCYTCPALRPYQFGPMRNPDVTKGHSDWLWSRTNHQPPGTGNV